MRRTILAAAAALALLWGCAKEQGEEQVLVDRATLTVQELMTARTSAARDLLRKAKGAMICPRVFKAGFFVGGEGGGCVLLGRAANGTWSYPAFYAIGSGSFGFQFGVQDAQMILLILTDKGLGAVMDSQFKFGANAGIAVATLGAEVQASTTAAVGADIVAFALARGLFGGVALEGSIMSSRTEWNQGYYGQPFGGRQIVSQMQGVNPGADPLRQILTDYGGSEQPVATRPDPDSEAAEPPPARRTTGAAPRPQTLSAPNQQQVLRPPPGAAGRAVQEQTLAPPSR